MVAATKTSCKMASTLCQKQINKTWCFVQNLKTSILFYRLLRLATASETQKSLKVKFSVKVQLRYGPLCYRCEHSERGSLK